MPFKFDGAVLAACLDRRLLRMWPSTLHGRIHDESRHVARISPRFELLSWSVFLRRYLAFGTLALTTMRMGQGHQPIVWGTNPSL
jgi:hypothetical protein